MLYKLTWSQRAPTTFSLQVQVPVSGSHSAAPPRPAPRLPGRWQSQARHPPCTSVISSTNQPADNQPTNQQTTNQLTNQIVPELVVVAGVTAWSGVPQCPGRQSSQCSPAVLPRQSEHTPVTGWQVWLLPLQAQGWQGRGGPELPAGSPLHPAAHRSHRGPVRPAGQSAQRGSPAWSR